MVFSIIPAFLMGGVSNYAQLLTYGFFIGVALASFSVGVAFVNGWYPPERQGSCCTRAACASGPQTSIR